MALPAPSAATLAVYSDIGCPWARLCVHRIHRARRRAGLEDRLRIEHRTFPLELVNSRPTPKRVVEAEAAVVAGLDEQIEWRLWEAPVETFPVTTLPAMEAVQAAAAQDPRLGECLDLALRDAFFRHSRCISIRSVVLEVAGGVAGLDVDALGAALDEGRYGDRVRCAPDGVQGSPHVVLPDGSDVFNPGLEVRMLEGHIPVVEADRAGAVDELVQAAAA